jgi:hypothetical protein
MEIIMKSLSFLSVIAVAATMSLLPVNAVLASAPAGNATVTMGNAGQMLPLSQLLPLIGSADDRYVTRMENATRFQVFDLQTLLSPAQLTQVKGAETEQMASVQTFQDIVNADEDLTAWLKNHGIAVDQIVAIQASTDRIEIYLF